MCKLRFKIKNSKGFSLVELIVVIAIMAVLVGILTPTLIKQIEKSNRSRDMTNAKHIEQILLDLCINGNVQIPEIDNPESSSGYGVWIMLCNKIRILLLYLIITKRLVECGAVLTMALLSMAKLLITIGPIIKI